MAILREKLWLWGQSPDAHYEKENTYSLPGHSRMTAVEGCYYFGIPNICRVRMMGHPMPPYDQESEVMRPCKNVVWSLLGAGGEPVTEWGDVEEVIRQAKMYKNISGGVFDDFFLPHRITHYTPEKLSEIKSKMNTEVGRKMDMWVVCYEDKLDNIPNIGEYLREFDVVSYWTWRGEKLDGIERNLKRIKEHTPKSRLMLGVYMWNYGERKPLTIEQMIYQTDLAEKLLKSGEIDGIIVCSNCIADLGIEAVEFMKNWIDKHADDIVPDSI